MWMAALHVHSQVAPYARNPWLMREVVALCFNRKTVSPAMSVEKREREGRRLKGKLSIAGYPRARTRVLRYHRVVLSSASSVLTVGRWVRVRHVYFNVQYGRASTASWKHSACKIPRQQLFPFFFRVPGILFATAPV